MSTPKEIPLYDMPIVSVNDRVRHLGETGERVSVLWQEPESLVFVARGRE